MNDTPRERTCHAMAAPRHARKKARGHSAFRVLPDSRVLFAVSFAIFMTVFALSLATSYPGQCSPDSVDIINQALGTSHYSNWHRYEGLSAHHPPFYTFLVWIAFTCTAWAGDTYLSIATAITLQAVYVAAAAAVAIALFNEAGAPRWSSILAIAFLAFTPVLPAHVVTLWKDAPFSATVLLLSAYLVYLQQAGEITPKRAIGLVAIIVPICLLRSNGLIVCMVVLLAMLLAFHKGRRIVASSAVLVLAMSLVITGPAYSALYISKAHFSEAMAMPIQQLAAVIHEGEPIQGSETLDRILPLEQWGESYDPTTSNPIKFNPAFDDAYLEGHKAEFLQTWLANAPTHLDIYARAWADETRGYWEPGYQSVIAYAHTIGEKETVDLLHAGTNPAALANSPRLRGIVWPLSGMGTYIWLLLAGMVASAILGGRKGLAQCALAVSPMLALYGTLLLAAPIVDDYRYVLPLYLVLPFLPYLVFRAARQRADRAPSGR